MPSKALLRRPMRSAPARRLPGVTGGADVEASLKRRDASRTAGTTRARSTGPTAQASRVRGRAGSHGERRRSGTATRSCAPATPSWSAPAAARSSHRSPAWTPSALDQPGRDLRAGAAPARRTRRRRGRLRDGQAWRRSDRTWCCWSAGPAAAVGGARRRRGGRGLRRTGWTCGSAPARSVGPADRGRDRAAGGGRDDRGRRGAGRHRPSTRRRRPRAGGRRPEPDGPLTVDDTGWCSGVDGDWLYAAGDVTGRAPLTHQGKYDARIVGEAIGARAAGRPVDTAPWGEHVATADHAAVPQVVFTDPEVASVGRTAAQAREAGLRVRVVDLPIAVAGVDDPGRELRRRGADGRRRGPRRSSSA